jgi:cell division protein FtsW
MILSSSAVTAYQEVGQARYYFYRQLIWGLIGIVACFFAATVPMDLVKKLTPLLYLAGVFLLVLVLLPFFGREASGALRWIDLGFIGFQPSTFAKLILVLTLAYYLSETNLKPNEYLKHLVTTLVLTFLYAFLVAIEPDIGTAFQIGSIGLVMLFLAGIPMGYLITVGLMSTPLVAATIFTSGYRRERVIAFLNPWSDPYGSGYHIIQSLRALARGGLSGLGLGESIAKKGYLPEPYTDSIVVVLGEELGLIGISLLLVLLLFLVFKAFSLSMKTRDSYKKMIGGGIAFMIGLQVFLNLAVISGTIPTTGVAMPFISYGGSSLLVNLIAVGLLLNISKGDTNV